MNQERYMSDHKETIKCYGSMINDKIRNRFYENLFKENLKDQTVLEVGFGTGLLSYLALESGAKSINAFEQRIHIYDLAKEILKDLEGSEKITLTNERFHSKFTDHDVLIHELLSENLWGEYLYYAIKDLKHKILPAQYFMRAWFQVIDQDNIKTYNEHDQRIIEQHDHFVTTLDWETVEDDYLFKFDPGVNLPEKFVQATDNHIKDLFFNHTQVTPNQVKIPLEEFSKEINSNYFLDLNSKILKIQTHGQEETSENIDELPQRVTVPIFTAQEECSVIVQLSFGIANNEEEFVITDNYPGKSWDQFSSKDLSRMIRVKKGKTLCISQNLTDGKFTFHNLDQDGH